MKPAPRRWILPEVVAEECSLAERVLRGRGLDRAAITAILGTPADYLDPLGLRGMTDAVAVLREALGAGRRIAIYGDYDADGVTACAMLTLALREVGADVLPYIPNRMSEGYGLHEAAIADLAERGVECVVTVDCGTSSVAAARSRPPSMRLIVTDHHLPLAPDGTPPQLAPADALINPKQPGCEYGFDRLAGAGVAWKLLQALEDAGLVSDGVTQRMQPLAALGTVADMMPLTGENRRLVAEGLPAMRDITGLAALCEVAGIDAAPSASDVAFGLGPRINAAGRMEDARLALSLLLEPDINAARAIAAQLNSQNVARQQAVARAMAEAERMVAHLGEDEPAIVLGDPGWPMGIVGLVAGRICERYARPTFAVCLDPAEAKGSARTIPGVHIVQALDGAADTLIRYGGHAVAAGFSLEANRFAEFRQVICASVARQLGDRPRERVFTVDARIRCADAVRATHEELARLEPCGQGNHAPALMLSDVAVMAVRSFGSDGQHLSVTVGDGDGAVEAIAFHKPGVRAHLPIGRRIDLCCTLELDRWRGGERIRLKLRDLRPAQSAAAVEVRGIMAAPVPESAS